MKKLVTLLLIYIATLPIFAHSDIIITYQVGNVKAGIKYGFYQHEERNKAKIITELADRLLKDLGYNKNVNIYFDRYYIKEIAPVYEIRYDKISPEKEDEIFIRVKDFQHNTSIILQLIEYAVANTKFIKENQKEKREYLGYSSFDPETKISKEEFRTTLTIDEKTIEKILKKPVSKKIKNVIKNRVYRPESEENKEQFSHISYYVENDKYHIYRTIHNYASNTTRDSLILTLNTIHQFESLMTKTIVFDSDSSFYAIAADRLEEHFLSKRHIIENLTPKHYPFQAAVSGNIVSISISQYEPRPFRNAIYRFDDDYLLQDLNTVLDSISGNSTENGYLW